LAGLLCAVLAWWPQWALSRYSELSAQEPARAEAWKLKSLRIAPEDASVWEDLARARLKRRESLGGAGSGALAALSEAARLSPKNALYRLIRGELLLGRGDPGGAAVEAASAAALEPASPQARLLLAQALYDMGRFREAHASLDEALRLREAAKRLPAGGTYDKLVLGMDEGRLEALSRLLRAFPTPG